VRFASKGKQDLHWNVTQETRRQAASTFASSLLSDKTLQGNNSPTAALSTPSAKNISSTIVQN
jgi:hypothetical protein